MTDAAHRLLWTVVGLLLVAGGTTVLTVDADPVLLGAGLREAWRLATPWSTLAAAVAGLLCAVAGQRLLHRTVRRPEGTLRGVLTRPGVRPGRTRLASDVLVRALERDLVQAAGVRRARVVLSGAAPRPDVQVHLDLAGDARAATVHPYVHAAVRRFARTADCRPAHLDVTAWIEPDRP
ncbi:hypothetical protein ACN263_13860 [Micromonospora sp. WMMD729]|uniref:hypothetical protein n=1 Tax=Micromonospora sp. WMMD729 TaxID=3404127 RepID=UPI003BF5FA62